MSFWETIRNKMPEFDPETGASPFSGILSSRRPAPRRACTTQGHARKLITHRPNPLKKLTKPFVCGLPRRRGLPMRHNSPAPTQDQVREVECALGIRVHVKFGHMYNRDTNVVIDPRSWL